MANECYVTGTGTVPAKVDFAGWFKFAFKEGDVEEAYNALMAGVRECGCGWAIDEMMNRVLGRAAVVSDEPIIVQAENVRDKMQD